MSPYVPPEAVAAARTAVRAAYGNAHFRSACELAIQAAAPLIAAEAVRAERERIREYIASRREGLNDDDPYERGKDMAYLGILDHLSERIT